MRVVTIGDFDGVHYGHQEILNQLKIWGASLVAEPMVLSFDSNTKGSQVLTETPLKKHYVQACGIKHFEVLPFEEWKEVSAEAFVRYLKEELYVVGVVCGKDFRFGKDRLGTEFTLISGGIAVRKIENITAEDVRISSSAIRKLIAEGALEKAEERLGHPFALQGEVCHGKGLARKYNTPTVNLSVSERQLLPPFGVYAAWVYAEGTRYPAVANIGVRPTVEFQALPNLEAHILCEVPELYGKELRVELKSYLRKETKFDSEEELFLQIQKDGERSKARLEMLK